MTAHPEARAAELRRAVLAETGLSCSVGIGDTLQRAKIATGFAKPAGVYRLTEANWMQVMGHRPTEALWGVGARTAARLAEIGIGTVAELASADTAELVARFGPRTGPWFRQLGQGGGDTQVTDEPWVPRSRSREATYPKDLTERAAIDEQVATMAAALTREVVAERRSVVRVAVKVRYSNFFTRTKISKLPASTTDTAVVAAAALAVLDRFELDRPVRLLGVRVELAPPAPDDRGTERADAR